MRFDELDFSYDVLDALDAMRFEECTPIQEKSMPVIMDGRDIIAVAQTGTGKTAAYLLPIIDALSDGGYPEDAVNCIVMSPTRELAMQIDQQLEGFSYYLNLSSLAIYGGTDGATFARQQKGLLSGADIVVATPGRLLAHLQMGKVDLSRVSFFVLDEADRMLDMGFFDDIMRIVNHLPHERQTLMFSATMPPKIQQLAKTILHNPAEIKIAVSKPADKIHQSAYVCYEPQKLHILKDLFKRQGDKRVIVFASSKLNVKELARELRRAKYKIGEMHSDLDQTKREEVMRDFKAGHIDILVATDIVARGIDIEDIAMVVNYDVPHDAEDYVHRIGRTARAQAEGIAVTFVNERDQYALGQIEQFLGYEILKNPIPEEIGQGPAYRPDRRPHGGNQRGGARGKAGGRGARHNAGGNPNRGNRPHDGRNNNGNSHQRVNGNTGAPRSGQSRRRNNRPPKA